MHSQAGAVKPRGATTPGRGPGVTSTALDRGGEELTWMARAVDRSPSGEPMHRSIASPGPGHLDGVLRRRVARYDVLRRLGVGEVLEDVRLARRDVDHVAGP